MIKYLNPESHNLKSLAGHKILFRSVSTNELEDILLNGLRTKPGTYEAGKLFAPTINEAATFGKNNFGFDNEPNTIIVVQINLDIYNHCEYFEADGMNAILIYENYLNLLKVIFLNYSPII